MSAENTKLKARKGEGAMTQQLVTQARDLDGHKHETLNAQVEQQVLHELARPPDLLKVQVRPLWAGGLLGFEVDVTVAVVGPQLHAASPARLAVMLPARHALPPCRGRSVEGMYRAPRTGHKVGSAPSLAG